MAQSVVSKSEFQRGLHELLEQDDRDCKILMAAYDKAETCLKKDEVLTKLVLEFDSNFLSQVQPNIADLKTADRPIFVIGETSAGKSSFLNLLIGRRIVPEMSAPCTNCVYCIKKGRKLEAHISSVDGSTPKKIISGDGMSDETFREELSKLLEEDVNSVDRCIDLFVQSEMLEDNLYFVDTPGFGDTERMTQLMLQYLPKAIGIIFIMNATLKLGLSTEGDGVMILNEILTLAAKEKEKIPLFDPKNIIFIANKWDQIKEDKEDKNHKKKMIQKLKSVWPLFEERLLLTLSVKRVQKVECNPDKKAKYRSEMDAYYKVLDRIRETVHLCATARSSVHKTNLETFSKKLKTCLDVVDSFSKLSPEEKQKKNTILHQMVAEFESKYKEGDKTISDLIESKDEIARDVHQYLNNADNKEMIFTWRSDDLPGGENYDDIRNTARNRIRKFITKAILDQIKGHDLTAKLRRQVSELIQKIREKEIKVECFLSTGLSVSTPEPWNRSSHVTLVSDNSYDDPLISDEVAFALVSSPIWFPIGVVASLLVFPVVNGVRSARNAVKRSTYNRDKRKKLEEWEQEILQEEFTLPYLQNCLDNILFKKVHKHMENFSKSFRHHQNILKNLDSNERTGAVLSCYSKAINLCDYLDYMLHVGI